MVRTTVLDDKLIIVGGETTSREVTNRVLFFGGGQRKDHSEMSTARHGVAAVGYHSVLITMGGLTKTGGIWTVQTTTELLDTNNGLCYTCDDWCTVTLGLLCAMTLCTCWEVMMVLELNHPQECLLPV